MKNNIMALAIGAIILGSAAGAKTLKTDSGPAEVPPANYKGLQYVDSQGCVYIRAGSGNRILWVPRVNRKRQVFCSPKNKPSLSPVEIAKITGKPATKLINPAKKADPVVETQQAEIPSSAVATAKPDRADQAVIAAPNASTKINSVRGHSSDERRHIRESIRNNTQIFRAINTPQSAQSTPHYNLQQTYNSVGGLQSGVDPVHNISVYPVVIDADVTPRGDAQMALIWTNTVPRKLIKNRRAKLIANTNNVIFSSKSR